MSEYTYKDIIIEPTSEEAKSYIGKECYFSNNPNDCLKHANTYNSFFVGILQFINPNDIYPFYFGGKDELTAYSYIIPKKQPKYVPFLNKEEFLSAYEKHTKSMKKYGIWIFNNINGIDYLIACLITEIWNDGIVIGSARARTLWKYLLECFVFEDGTPCGKENNNG